MIPKFKLGKIFVQCTYRSSFIILRLIVQTNKQIHKESDAAKNIHLTLLYYAGG